MLFAAWRLFFVSGEGNDPSMTERETRSTQIRSLREVTGLTFGTIGERLGISSQAVWQAYQRAIQPKQSRKHHASRSSTRDKGAAQPLPSGALPCYSPPSIAQDCGATSATGRQYCSETFTYG